MKCQHHVQPAVPHVVSTFEVSCRHHASICTSHSTSRSRRSSRDVDLEWLSTLWNATIARRVLRRKVLRRIDGASILIRSIVDLLEASDAVRKDIISKFALPQAYLDLTSSHFPSPA